jgi:Rrf2 family protein
MGRGLSSSKAAEYAVAALSRLALSEDGALVSVAALARAQDLPRSFLAKIVAQAARAGLLRTRTGADGGVSLARPAARITLLEILEAFEGPYARSACVFYPARACEGPSCPVFCPLRRKEQGARDSLAGATLADMAASLLVHPDNPHRASLEAS